VRITNSMMSESTLANINDNAKRLAAAKQLVSSQKKIKLPSDDPVVATRAMKYRNYVSNIEQYQKNVTDATSWQKVTDQALGSLGQIMDKIKDITTKAASTGTVSDTQRAAYKAEALQLREQAIDVLNTSYAGRYVFGGYATDKPPYELASTTIGQTVLFKGQYLSLCGVVSSSVSDNDIQNFYQANSANAYKTSGAQSIKYNIGFGSEMPVNVEGQNVTGTGADSTNLFDTLAKLALALDSAAGSGSISYKTYNAKSAAANKVETKTFTTDQLLTDLDKDIKRLTTARTDLGARMQYTGMVSERLEDDAVTYKELKSTNEDVNTAQASIAASSAQYVYEASLTVGAKAISKTLVDYLT